MSAWSELFGLGSDQALITHSQVLTTGRSNIYSEASNIGTTK